MKQSTRSGLFHKIEIIALLCGAMIAVHVFNGLLNGALFQFGIHPRDTERLFHVVTAPWIHGSLGHLFNNLVGMIVFSWLCLIRSVRLYVFSSVVIVLVCGVLVWLFGREANHIGASGWIFGLWSLSIAIAWFDRRLVNILIAMLVILFYGGMVMGILPHEPDVSFESHLFGALAGVLAAWLSNLPAIKKRLRE